MYRSLLVDLGKIYVTTIRVTSLLNVSDCPRGSCQSFCNKDQDDISNQCIRVSSWTLARWTLQGSEWHGYSIYQIVLVDLVKVSVTSICNKDQVDSINSVSDCPCGSLSKYLLQGSGWHHHSMSECLSLSCGTYWDICLKLFVAVFNLNKNRSKIIQK